MMKVNQTPQKKKKIAKVEGDCYIKSSDGRMLVNLAAIPEEERPRKLEMAIDLLRSIGYEVER